MSSTGNLRGLDRQPISTTGRGGDGFAFPGFFYGLLSNETPEQALRLGWAHGALSPPSPATSPWPALARCAPCPGRIGTHPALEPPGRLLLKPQGDEDDQTDRLTRSFGKQIAQGEFEPGIGIALRKLNCAFASRFLRNVMREVIKVLSTKKLIDAAASRPFVMPREQWNHLDADVLEWMLEKGATGADIDLSIEVRSLIEPAISRRGGRAASAVDLVAIESSYNEMNANRCNVRLPGSGHPFFKAILAATSQPVIQQLSDAG